MIRNIWAIGRNYSEHAKELGNPLSVEPMIFLKAGSSVQFSQEITLPAWTREVHHELEVAFRFAEDLSFDEFGLALDLTERQVQKRLKENSLPWTLAKSFTGSCPITQFVKKSAVKDLENEKFFLRVNGDLRQEGHLSQMLFPLEKIRDFVVAHFPVCPGDLLLTGTPAGVGPLQRGDQVEVRMGGLIHHIWKVI